MPPGCLRPFRDRYTRGFVLSVKQGPTFLEESKNLFKGVTSTKPRAWCHCCDWCNVLEINLKHKGGGFILKHPQNRSGKGMSSQSMPNLFSQPAKRLSSDRETTSGLKPLDRLDVECGSSNQLQILHICRRK